MEHRKGKNNANADMLSRLSQESEVDDHGFAIKEGRNVTGETVYQAMVKIEKATSIASVPIIVKPMT